MKLTRTLRILITLAGLFAVSGLPATAPSFTRETVFSPNAAAVAAVKSSLATDIVILEGGLAQGMRIGVVCRVERAWQSIGEIIIIESKTDRSAGLILGLSEQQTIREGDIARVQTF